MSSTLRERKPSRPDGDLQAYAAFDSVGRLSLQKGNLPGLN